MNSTVKSRAVVWTLVLFLAACVYRKDTDYYLTHPEEIQSTYDVCAQRDKVDQPASKECAAVFRAIPIVKQYLTELINSPEQFALNIMTAQSQMARLQSEYHVVLNQSKNRNDLHRISYDINKQKLEIESRYALIRLVSHID